MMGHSRLDTTGIYLSATAEDLKEAMSRHPLSAVSANAPGELVAGHRSDASGNLCGQMDQSLLLES